MRKLRFHTILYLLITTLVLALVSRATLLRAEEAQERSVQTVIPQQRTAEPMDPQGEEWKDHVQLLTDPTKFPKMPDHPAAIALPQEVINKLSPDELGRIVKMQLRKPHSLAELIFQEDILVPGIVFTSFAVMAFLLAYYSYRKRRDVIETVQAAIKSGQALPDSFIEALENKKKPTRETDLRKAVLLLALGLSAIIILLCVAPAEQKGTAALGILPTLLGCAYLLLWKTSQNKPGPG